MGGRRHVTQFTYSDDYGEYKAEFVYNSVSDTIRYDDGRGGGWVISWPEFEALLKFTEYFDWAQEKQPPLPNNPKGSK